MAEKLGYEVTVKKSFDEAVEIVTTELKKEGFGILTRIDVDRTLKEKLGADFRRYAILGACNPPLAHRALSHRGDIGILLPCNVTVEVDADEGCLVRILNPDIMLGAGELHQDEVLQVIADEAKQRLQRVVTALEQS